MAERSERIVGSKYRCDNCPHYFKAKTKNQRFCTANCKNQFHNYGSAFGKLKEILSKEIRKLVKAEVAAALGDGGARVHMVTLEGGGAEPVLYPSIDERVAALEDSLRGVLDSFDAISQRRKQPQRPSDPDTA